MGDSAATPGASLGGRRSQWLTIALIISAVVGLVLAVELTHIHHKVNSDAEFSSFCNIGEAINCDDVAASAYSDLFGVPVSVWGFFAYVVLLGLALAGSRRDAGGRPLCFPFFLFLWAIGGLVSTLALAVISVWVIGTFCVLCGGLYVVNLVVFGLALVRLRQWGGLAAAMRGDLDRLSSHPAIATGAAAALLAIAALLIVFYPQQHKVEELPPTMPAGECLGGATTDDGLPYIGAANALVTIQEFSDYQCAHCRRAHVLLRGLLQDEAYRGKVRLVHRHFPLDQACHPKLSRPFHRYACAASRAAICAGRQGKFWEYSDHLFAHFATRGASFGRREIDTFNRELGLDQAAFEACLADPTVDSEVGRDLRDGLGWGVRGTPCFVLNDEVFVEGAKTEAQFRRLIDDELARCTEAAASASPALPAPPPPVTL